MSYYVGIDLGGTNIVAGVLDESYNIIAKCSVKTLSKRPANEIIDDMSHVAMDAVKKAGVSIDEVSFVGVGAPGTINQATGMVEYSNNLDWHDVPIQAMLQERMQKPVFIDNDANAAAYGEYMAGSARDVDISIMITLGTGVGGGIVINNQVYTGFNYAGAELGHSVIVLNGRPCTCGRNGCLESYASATGLIITTKEAMEKDKTSGMWKVCDGDITRVNGRTAFTAANTGDKSAQAVVDSYISALACGITNVVNTFQPDILCIGGGVSNEGDNLMNPLRAKVKAEVYSRNSARNTEIVLATLGGDAGVIGAALLGKQNKN